MGHQWLHNALHRATLRLFIEVSSMQKAGAAAQNTTPSDYSEDRNESLSRLTDFAGKAPGIADVERY